MLLNCPKPFGNCSDILASDFSNPCSNTAAAAFVFGRRFVAFDVARRLLHEHASLFACQTQRNALLCERPCEQLVDRLVIESERLETNEHCRNGVANAMLDERVLVDVLMCGIVGTHWILRRLEYLHNRFQ